MRGRTWVKLMVPVASLGLLGIAAPSAQASTNFCQKFHMALGSQTADAKMYATITGSDTVIKEVKYTANFNADRFTLSSTVIELGEAWTLRLAAGGSSTDSNLVPKTFDNTYNIDIGTNDAERTTIFKNGSSTADSSGNPC